MQLDEKARQYLSEALNWMLPARIFVDVHFYYNMICLYMHIFSIYGYEACHVTCCFPLAHRPILVVMLSSRRRRVVVTSSSYRRRVVASSSSRRRRAVVVPSSCRRRVVVMSSSRRRHVVASCPSRFLPSSSVYLLNYDKI